MVKDALLSRGVAVEDDIFESCALRLYGITKSYVKVRVVKISLLSILLFFYSAKSHMADQCAVQDIINVLININ